MFNLRVPIVLVLAASVLSTGCFVVRPPCVVENDLDHYRTLAKLPIPDCDPTANGQEPLSTAPPLLVDADTPPPTWDLKLEDAIRLGLENAKVLRDLGGSVLRAPTMAQTIHDPAIQATDPRFGMEVLAAFDAQLATRFIAQHNDRAFNNLFLGGGTFLFNQELDNIETELSKKTATGASFALRHRVEYDENNAAANVFRSYWNTIYEGEFRQPLMQGGGVEFNRIAGPYGTPGMMNGIVLARIDNDVSTAQFELGVRDFISNLENAYWDLYFAYRELDARVAARDAALTTWRIIHANVEEGRGYSKLQEVQALEQYYRFQEQVLDAMGGRVVERTRTNNGSNGGTFRAVGGVQAAERRLRLWMGLPINDGRLIRTVDEPPQVKVAFDWNVLSSEALARRPELRRQKAQVQKYNAELAASRNFLLPKLDFIGRYRFRGYGNAWMGPSDPAAPFENALANLLTGQFQEWEMGMEYSMPLGFRREYAAVRNAQFHVAREQAILQEQERQAIHDLAAAFADADRAFSMSKVSHDRLSAAQDQYRRAYDAFFELGGKVSLELVLDARVRLAEAEIDFHRARVDYAVALKNVHFEKGSLLDYDGAMLADGACEPGAAAGIAGKRRFRPDHAQVFNYVMSDFPDEGSHPLPQHIEADTTEPAPPSPPQAPAFEPAPVTQSTPSQNLMQPAPRLTASTAVAPPSDVPGAAVMISDNSSRRKADDRPASDTAGTPLPSKPIAGSSPLVTRAAMAQPVPPTGDSSSAAADPVATDQR